MDGRRPPTEASQHVALEICFESVERKARMYLERKSPAKPTIFRVPPGMRCGNRDAYEPKMVSIGPYHRGKSEDLKTMEELKWRLLHHYLSKVPNGSKNEGLRKMKDLEKQSRECYSEVIDLKSDQFVEMLLLDGCFLVQIFIASFDAELGEEELKSLLRNNSWFANLVSHDLLLLENQLPYFIVEHLLNTLEMPGWDISLLQKVVISWFSGFLRQPQYLKNQQPELPSQCFEDVDHLLHLFHQWILSIQESDKVSNTRSCNRLSLELLCSALSLMIYKTGDCLSKVLPCCNCYSPKPITAHKKGYQLSVPIMTEHVEELSQSGPTMIGPAAQGHPPSGSTKTERAEEIPSSVPTMTELVEAGVKVKVRKAKSFLNISFYKGVLEIPAINVVDDYTNFLFANLIAWEQCSRTDRLDVTHYTLFLDGIINTPMDVELLHQKGIIHRDLGSNKVVASLFNELGNGVSYDPKKNYLMNVHKGLNAYCQSRWPRWRAKAVHDYFSNPWAIISLGAAVLLVGLTILQSVYAVLDYYKK
uniref:UPF0481 protein At3g47200-like n=1 Tax=Elaeis guineensis var. tenera TaxID=51953 RepID=A0A8N4EZ64_ELAGV|nr:UPF0481 protein At3g47200-like [Elaeis guineensis]